MNLLIRQTTKEDLILEMIDVALNIGLGPEKRARESQMNAEI